MNRPQPDVFRVGSQEFCLTERTLVMGVLNVTPDSFSDGGRFLDPDAALRQAERMIEEGVDIIDVGGESSRPAGPYGDGAERVSEEEGRVETDRRREPHDDRDLGRDVLVPSHAPHRLVHPPKTQEHG